jgi:hypothetical protein
MMHNYYLPYSNKSLIDVNPLAFTDFPVGVYFENDNFLRIHMYLKFENSANITPKNFFAKNSKWV